MQKIKQSLPETIFDFFNYFLMAVLIISMLYPFIYTLNISFADPSDASAGGYFIIPKSFNLTAYKNIISDGMFWIGYKNTILRTLIGTVLSVFMTCLCAYPLSRRDMPHRKLFTFIVIFTMIFSGGLIPNFILYNNLGLIDNPLIYILPGLIAAFNVILVKNFFQGISNSLHEAASIDGASEWYIFTRLYLPLSKPIIATIALFNAVGHWNAWFDSLLFINSEGKKVVQTFLQRIAIEGDTSLIESGLVSDAVQMTPESIKAAIVIVTIVPMLCVYPFVQKFFNKGIMLGGVKE
ncbi:MAG: carbohydrate ABC transporter permease [Lentisphaeria bacterium]|nr:carbohydrate ABC transporter permease [Lentisphaeria bacterium]NQZ69318.1 carbohydrate ABC transporter permease [Lentisphaeria bacterium]